VLVIGDVCLDEYVIGRPARLSREAPVPVLEFSRRMVVPGAAANPARNIRALGSHPSIVGVIGDDDPGRELQGVLVTSEMDTGGLVVDPRRSTSVKTRVVADSDLRVMQQVARIDRSGGPAIDPSSRQAMGRIIERTATDVDAILVSDYRAGVVDEGMIGRVRDVAVAHDKPTIVDTQGDLFRFRGYSLVRSNQPDAEASIGKRLASEDDFRQATEALRNELQARWIVITRGRDGVAVRGPDGFALLPAANQTEVFDAVGAGDTVIAVLALAMAAGADAIPAAQLANIAAGIVVRRLGNAVATPEELLAAIG
jgi:rfaE bifunctional protein kinase chain/domain